ncbi:MAG: TPM domain-containing protein [Planctomycetota bacterium]
MRSLTRWPTRTEAWALLIALAGLLGAAAPATDDATKPASQQPPAKRAGQDYSPFPNPDSGYVTDLAGLLSKDEEERIERWLWRIESKTQVEIIVLTLGSIADYPETPNQSIEAFATGLFNAYGIGNKPRNHGVLLLVARKDRKVRIELGAGYSRDRDADAAGIIQEGILPHFREDEYAEGIIEGVRAIMREFAGVKGGLLRFVNAAIATLSDF